MKDDAPIRICVCTPVYGDPSSSKVATRYAGAIYALSNDLDVLCASSHWTGPRVEIEPTGFHTTDVVHARSELVKRALAFQPRYTHLLWWDEDVVGSPTQITQLLLTMLRLDKDVIGVPYPQKRLDFAHAARELRKRPTTRGGASALEAEELEALCTPHYAFNLLECQLTNLDAQGLAKVTWMPIGFSLMKRAVLEKMTAAYAAELGYRVARYDEGGRIQMDEDTTTAMFMLDLKPGGELHHEDRSWCHRWRALGGELHLYAGAGSPLSHVGAHVFRGSPLAFRTG
jgi:hypothetical protein